MTDVFNNLIDNLDKLHTTLMGADRVKRNLGLDVPDVVAWCREQIARSACVFRKGKNWYIYTGEAVITVNAHSYTMITAHKSPIRVREIAAADYPALEDFLCQAVFVPPGEAPPPRDVIYNPGVFLYVDGFGSRRGDCGMVAESGGRIAGIAWTRIVPAYGHLDDDTPELAISVLPEYRGRFVGAILMTNLFGLLRSRGFRRTSLSVRKENAALRFYQRLGYETVREREDDFLMVRDLGME